MRQPDPNSANLPSSYPAEDKWSGRGGKRKTVISDKLVKFFFVLKLLSNLNEARPRLLIAIALFGLILAILPPWLPLLTRVMIAWDAGAVCLLALTFSMMLGATPKQMRRRAQRQDASRWVISSLVIAGACLSLLAIAFLLKNAKGSSASLLTLRLALVAGTIVSSWLLTHTVFALHYAHGCYRDDSATPIADEIGGLDFPSEKQPDYWDFLYFSLVIGMTSQVSDVQITSRQLRRLALVHGVLSFFFNTVILALSINLIAGLI